MADLRDDSIVVTGMGVINAAGDCPACLWNHVADGVSSADWYVADGENDDQRVPACALPQLEKPRLKLKKLNVRTMDQYVRHGLAAAHQAFVDGQLDRHPIDPSRFGIIVGTSRGPMQIWEETLSWVHSGARVPPSLAVNGTLACLSGTLSVEFEARGPGMTVSATCASGAYAISTAAQQIQLGLADAVLVGGADAPLYPGVLAQLKSMRILGSHDDPKKACRPFDSTRNGTIVGEGAGFLLLETYASAQKRGVTPRARLAGWALGADGVHRVATPEDGEGLHRVMMQACASAGVTADQIDYINAHGTGTKLNDRTEARVIHRFLGARSGRVPCSATKPITGHCLGATPVLEAIISILALEHQYVPPTINCCDLDPECQIDCVPLVGRQAKLRTVMTNSVGFWGYNASLIFSTVS